MVNAGVGQLAEERKTAAVDGEKSVCFAQAGAAQLYAADEGQA